MFGFVTAQGLSQTNYKDGYPRENPNDIKRRMIKNIANFIWYMVHFRQERANKPGFLFPARNKIKKLAIKKQEEVI